MSGQMSFGESPPVCMLCGDRKTVMSEQEDREVPCPRCQPQQPFGGVTFEEERDKDRLKAQLGRVKTVVIDGNWYTLYQISQRTGDPEQSVSARLRDLRKEKFGRHVIKRRYLADGVWEYRMES